MHGDRHGDRCGEHGKSNKGNPYEGSARIPFIMYGPGKVNAGQKVEQALGCVDFMPTVLPLMGFKAPDTVQGRDASALFQGKGGKTWNDVAILRSTGGTSWFAAVDKDLKLVISRSDTPWLFDRSADPHELDNLFGKPKYKERVRKLARELQTYGSRFNDAQLMEDHFARQLKTLVE